MRRRWSRQDTLGMEAIPIFEGYLNRRFVFDDDVGWPDVSVTTAMPTLLPTGTRMSHTDSSARATEQMPES